MHRAFRRAAAVLATTTLGAALLAAPASAATTGLSGTVLDDAGLPVSTCVQAYDPDGGYVQEACTDEAGQWSMPDLTGSFKVYVAGADYAAGEWYDDATAFDLAGVVDAPADLSTTLEVKGRLQGLLTDSVGAPVSYTNVDIYAASGDYVTSAFTNDFGGWETLVSAGDYTVHFADYSVDQWAYGAPDESSATVVTVNRGENTQVDDRLVPAPDVTTVSGTVTDAKGKPLENICASLVNPDDFAPWDSFGQACTGADGRYEIVPWGAAPAATVWFQDFSEVAVYAGEFAGGTYAPATAQRIDLSAGDVVVDASLSVGGVITGKAVTERKPNGLADVCPEAYSGHSGGQVWGAGTTCSGADGTYRLTALPPGKTAVLLRPSWRTGVADEWYQNADSQATATLTKVSLGGTTTLKSNRFVPGGVLTGTITDTSGRPVEGAYVYLEGRWPGRAGPGEGRFVAQTDAAGRYSMVAPAGTYTPLVDAPYEAQLAPEWSGNAVTRAAATPVTVRDYRTATFSASLAPASHITGQVVTADGSTPSPDIYVAGAVYTESGDHIGDLDAYDGSGFRFTGSNLPAGTFRVAADLYDMNTGESTRVWYDGATTEAGATLVPVAPGGTAEITFHLP